VQGIIAFNWSLDLIHEQIRKALAAKAGAGGKAPAVAAKRGRSTKG
jgi:hypothetical protein